MAIINTEDKYMLDLFSEHPEYQCALDDIISYRQKWFCRYGVPKNGFCISDFRDDDDYELIEKVKKVSIDLLSKLKGVCDRHGLKAYLIYGSLLGAVRSGGIIPGDDDIDLAMPRKDYNRLIELEAEFEKPYFLQHPGNDECFFGGYAKLRRTDTTAIHPQNWWVNCCEGIGIDIFPLDSGFENIQLEKRKRNRIMHLQRLLYAKAYGYFPRFMDMSLPVWKTYKYIGKLYSKEKLVDKLAHAMTLGDDSDKAPFGVYAHYCGRNGGRFTHKSAFDDSVIMTFEGIEVSAPKDWDTVLSDFYGENYITPTILGSRKVRHAFYNADVPYQQYKSRFTGIFKPMPSNNQKVVLIGDELMFKAYLKKYTDKTKSPWKQITVDNIEKLRKIKDVNIYPIICSTDIRKTEEAVRNIGLREYYIFTYMREWIQYANIASVERELKSVLDED